MNRADGSGRRALPHDYSHSCLTYVSHTAVLPHDILLMTRLPEKEGPEKDPGG